MTEKAILRAIQGPDVGGKVCHMLQILQPDGGISMFFFEPGQLPALVGGDTVRCHDFSPRPQGPDKYTQIIDMLHQIEGMIPSPHGNAAIKASRAIHDAICALEPLSSEWGSND